jgi:hypothetical protein
MFDPAREPFEILSLHDIGIERVRQACFAYPRLELSILAKPFLLGCLLDRGHDAAVFIDADVLILDTLEPLFGAAAAHSIVLTPHLVDPLASPDRIARELNIHRSGIYNGGCVGVSATSAGRRFVSWWKDRLQTHCRHAPHEGMHYDQRWLDLVPSLFEDVYIERDAAYNVAHWNLPERDGVAARFFHFSGFEPSRPHVVTKYSARLTMGSVGGVPQLFDRYVRWLECEGYAVTNQWPYAFDCFDNGVPIPGAARDLYRDLDDDAAHAFGDPFCTRGPCSFFSWLNESGAGLTAVRA